MEEEIAGNSRDEVVVPASGPALLPEIWLLIFPLLRNPELHSVSLTCSTFRYLAQPLLFSVLDVSPFLLSYNTEQPNTQPILRPKRYLDRVLQRVEHYKLPHIVHGVRCCWVSPYSRAGFPSRSQLDDSDAKFIINSVVQALHSFPNLTELHWHCIDISQEWWDVLCTLRIKKLWLNSSSIPPTFTTPLPYIVHIDLDQWPWEGKVTNHVSIHEEHMLGVDLPALQGIIHPETTESIAVPKIDTACRLFSVLSERTYNLRSLKIPFSSVRDSSFTDALENCPNLESLYIFPPSPDERYRDARLATFKPDALPCLTTYEGPYTHILQFSHQPLKDMSLWGFDERPSLCDPEGLVEALDQLADTSTIESLRSLKVTVISITRELLEAFGLFKRLEHLNIHSQDNSSRNLPIQHSTRSTAPVTMIYQMMTTLTLPRTLRFLDLTTRLSSPKTDLESQERDAASFTENIARNHPHMQRIKIGYGIYWTGTYTVIWGRIRGNSDIDSDPDGSRSSSSSAHTKSSQDDLACSRPDVNEGYSSESSSKDYILSTVVSTVHPLPLGKLTFTEHRRTILFKNDNGVSVGVEHQAGRRGGPSGGEEGQFWTAALERLRRLFGGGWF